MMMQTRREREDVNVGTGGPFQAKLRTLAIQTVIPQRPYWISMSSSLCICHTITITINSTVQ